MKNHLKIFMNIFIIFIFSFSLISCTQTPISSSKKAYKAEETVSTFFSLIKTGKLSEASNYLDKSNKEYNTDLKFKSSFEGKLLKDASSKIDCKILSSQDNGSTANVEVEITAPNLLTIYNDTVSNILEPIISKYGSANESEKQKIKNQAIKNAVEYVTKTLNSPDCPKTTNKARLALYEQNNQWFIKPNEDFLYALTGKMPQLLRK